MILALILPPSFHCENFQILENYGTVKDTHIFLLYKMFHILPHWQMCMCVCVCSYICIFTCVILGWTDLIVAHMFTLSHVSQALLICHSHSIIIFNHDIQTIFFDKYNRFIRLSSCIVNLFLNSCKLTDRPEPLTHVHKFIHFGHMSFAFCSLTWHPAGSTWWPAIPLWWWYFCSS